jgi:hypothetical protein
MRSCYKETDDDWAPSYILSTKNYPNRGPKLVKISFSQLSTKQWRVCVWGGDDLGMEKDFPESEKDEACDLFTHLISLDKVNIQGLLGLKFEYC